MIGTVSRSRQLLLPGFQLRSQALDSVDLTHAVNDETGDKQDKYNSTNTCTDQYACGRLLLGQLDRGTRQRALVRKRIIVV